MNLRESKAQCELCQEEKTMEPKYVPPYNTPEECDHEGIAGEYCSHCCPCNECGATRAENESEEGA